MPPRPLNIGVLGTAAIASRSVIPALQGLPEQFRLVAVASRTAARAEAFTRETGIPCREGYVDLLKNGELDAVYVPLPTGLHVEWVGRALDRGLHVLCEKSLASTGSEAIELVDRSETKRVALMETFQFRFHSQFRWLRDALASGMVGEERALAVNFGFPPFPDADNIRYRPELGGGALLDAGAYTLRLAGELFGASARVVGATLASAPGFEVDLRGGGMVVDGDHGRFMSVAFGFDHDYRCELDVWGSRGSIRMERLFTARPGFEPPVLVTKEGRTERTCLPQDDHFTNMLLDFHRIASVGGDAREREAMRLQARLMDEFRAAAA